MSGELDNYSRQIQDLVQQAYNDGFKAGEQAMLGRIQAAVAGPGASPQTSIIGSARSTPQPQTKRAPRGLVGEVVEAVLINEEGLSLLEIEERATTLDPRVAPKSISNELHRKKDVKYRQDGRKWYLLGSEKPEVANDDETSGSKVMF